MKKELSLVDIPIKKQCTVLGLNAAGLTRRRLLDLGLVPGTVITKLRYSPIGDPAAYIVKDAVIALRREEGKRVLVLPFAETGELENE